MSKDLFEIRIKEKLVNMKAPVPDGAWAAIKSGLPSAGATTASGGSFSSFGFGLSLAVGTALLVSLGVYSELKNEQANQIVVDEKAERQVDSSIETNAEENSEIANFEEVAPVAVISPEESVPVEFEFDAVAEYMDTDANDAPEAGEETTNLASDSENNIPVTPIIKIDTNGMSTADFDRESEDRTPIYSKAESDAVAAISQPSAEITSTKLEGYAPLAVTFQNLGEAEENIWDIDGQSLKGKTVETIFEEPGIYDVYLSAYNLNGSAQSDDQIQVVVKAGSDIKLPNIFTPNGDGLNDTYKVGYAKNISEFFIQIFDETGRVVYKSTELQAEWVFDQDSGLENRRYTVMFRAIGEDGKVHTDQFPLIVVRD